MSREEVIRMLREAGFSVEWPSLIDKLGVDFERFAFLVAAAEREACAVVAEKLGVHPALNVYNGGPDWYKHGKKIAAEIRARGQE